MITIQNLKKQKGMTSVEFAVVGGVFFVVLFAIIEFGRVMFVMNMLDEITRRGARLAAVCPVDAASQTFISNQARFNGDYLSELTTEMVDIEYFEEDGDLADLSNPATAVTLIRYVRASINGYQHQLLIPGFNVTVPVPDFSTTIPSESLGVHPDGSSASCT